MFLLKNLISVLYCITESYSDTSFIKRAIKPAPFRRFFEHIYSFFCILLLLLNNLN